MLVSFLSKCSLQPSKSSYFFRFIYHSCMCIDYSQQAIKPPHFIPVLHMLSVCHHSWWRNTDHLIKWDTGLAYWLEGYGKGLNLCTYVVGNTISWLNETWGWPIDWNLGMVRCWTWYIVESNMRGGWAQCSCPVIGSDVSPHWIGKQPCYVWPCALKEIVIQLAEDTTKNFDIGMVCCFGVDCTIYLLKWSTLSLNKFKQLFIFL